MIFLDAIDDMFLGNNWIGYSKEALAILGAFIGGIVINLKRKEGKGRNGTSSDNTVHGSDGSVLHNSDNGSDQKLQGD